MTYDTDFQHKGRGPDLDRRIIFGGFLEGIRLISRLNKRFYHV